LAVGLGSVPAFVTRAGSGGDVQRGWADGGGFPTETPTVTPFIPTETPTTTPTVIFIVIPTETPVPYPVFNQNLAISEVTTPEPADSGGTGYTLLIFLGVGTLAILSVVAFAYYYRQRNSGAG